MVDKVQSRISALLLSHRRRGMYLAVMAVLGVAVMLNVALILRRQGEAKTYEVQVLDCQYSGDGAHTHNADCYDADGNLVCPLQEKALHTHDDSCYASETYLVCGMEEGEGAHWHSDECYDEEGNLVCELEEWEGHVHTDECWQTDTWLDCGLEEVTEEHVHGAGCFKTITVTEDDPKPVVNAADTSNKNADDADDKMPAQKFRGELKAIDQDGNEYVKLVVSVKAPEGAFEAGTSMKIKAVNSDAIADKVDQAVKAKAGENAKAKTVEAVDISFFDKDGNEVEPAKKVEVKITSAAVRDVDAPVLVHVDKDADKDATVVTGTAKVNADDEDKTTGNEDTVKFNADEFSPYVITEVEDGEIVDEPEVVEDEPEAPAMPEQTFEATTEDGTQVYVFAPEGALPEGTQMIVAQADADVVAEVVTDAVEGRVKRVVAVDITFVDADGNKLDPQAALSVKITSPEVAEIDEPVLVHVPDEALEGDPEAVEVVEGAVISDSATGMVATSGDTVGFESDQFSVYAIVETVVIETPAGELLFEGDGYTVKITYTEESEIPLGTELTVRELVEGTDEYEGLIEQVDEAVNPPLKRNDYNNDVEWALANILNPIRPLATARFLDIELRYEGIEIEPNPKHPLTVEVRYDEPLMDRKSEENAETNEALTNLLGEDYELEAEVVHFAEQGDESVPELIENVEVETDKDGDAVAFTYEQASFSTSAFALFGGNQQNPSAYTDITTNHNAQYFFPSQAGINYLKTHPPVASNYLIFRYGPYGPNGENVFQLGATAVEVNGALVSRPNGVFPGDPEFPDPDGHGTLASVCTLNQGTTIMEILEAAYRTTGTNGQQWYTVNFNAMAPGLGWVSGDYNLSGGIKFIMNATYEIDDDNLAQNAANPQCTQAYTESAGVSVGYASTNGSTEYWRANPSGLGSYNGWQPVTIQRGQNFDGVLVHVENRIDKNFNMFYGVIIDNYSANATTRVSDGSSDSLAGLVEPIAVEIVGSPGLLRMEAGSKITDSSVSSGGDYYGTGAKLINGGRIELFGVGAYGDAKIEHMAVGVDQINGKTSIKTSITGYNDNEISIALTHGQSIGKWIDNISQSTTINLWLRNVEQWHSGDIVMDTGRNNVNSNGYKEYAVPVTGNPNNPTQGGTYDLGRLNFQNANAIQNYATEMGLEYYTGTYSPSGNYGTYLPGYGWVVNVNHQVTGTYPFPYPVIRFYVGTVLNTRTGRWYRTLYDAVNCQNPVELQGSTYDGPNNIQDGDTLVFYGNTVEDKDITVNYDLTIRSSFTGENVDSRSGNNTTARFEGDHTITVAAGKTVTFGGNATTGHDSSYHGIPGTVTTGTPSTLTIDGNGTATNNITNNGTLNLKDHITLANAKNYAVLQNGEEHLYEGALFDSNGTADHFLASSGNASGNHYITLETTNPNGGDPVNVSIGPANTQYNGRDVVVAGTNGNVGTTMDANYLAKFPLISGEPDAEYDYVYTVNGGPTGQRVLELKRKASVTVQVYKTDENGSPLSGAGFTLFKDENGTLVEYHLGSETNPHVTDANGIASMTVREGSYVLKETGVPSGYDGDSTAMNPGLSFTVTKNNGVLTLSGNGFSLVSGTTDTYQVTVQNTRKTVPVTLLKKDTHDILLDGVTFTMDGNTYTTDSNGEVSLGNLKWGSTYMLDETQGDPSYELLGYRVIIEVNGTNGTVTARKSTTQEQLSCVWDANAGRWVVTVVNQPKTVRFQLFKVGEDTNGAGLAGSGFTLTPTGGGSAITLTQSSTTGLFEPVDLEAGTYTISETTTPTGYDTVVDATIVVAVTPNKVVSMPTQTDGYSIPEQTSGVWHVTVTDPRKTATVTLKKVDINDAPISGVTFDLDITGNTKTTGDGTGGTTLGEVTLGTYKYGESTVHTLTETWSSANYLPLNGPIGFKINADGTLYLNPTQGDQVTSIGTADSGYTIVVTNKPSTVTVRFAKVGVDNAPLANAVFTATGEITGELRSDTSGAIKQGTTSEFALHYGGQGVTLTETSAPAGYNKLASAVQVSVNSNGVITVSPNGVVEKSGPDQGGVYTITIHNSAGQPLPNTGGPGTTLFTITGSAVCIAAAVTYGLTSRRKARREVA